MRVSNPAAAGERPMVTARLAPTGLWGASSSDEGIPDLPALGNTPSRNSFPYAILTAAPLKKIEKAYNRFALRTQSHATSPRGEPHMLAVKQGLTCSLAVVSDHLLDMLLD